MVEQAWANIAALLRIIHDTVEIPQLRHIRQAAMVRLSELNDDLAKANTPPTSYDPTNDPLKQAETKPKAIPASSMADSVKRI